jgi:hypothetical protein
MNMWNVVQVVNTCGLRKSKPLPTILVDTGVYGHGVMMGLACAAHENGMFLVGEHIGEDIWLVTDMIFPPCKAGAATWEPSEDRDVVGTWHTHPFDKSGTLAFSPIDLGEDGIVQNYDISILSNGIGVVTAMVREPLKCGALIITPARVCPYDTHLSPRLLAEQSRNIKRTTRVVRAQQTARQYQPPPNDDDGFTWIPNENEEAYVARLGLSDREVKQLLENGVEARDLMAWGLEREHIEEYGLLGNR